MPAPIVIHSPDGGLKPYTHASAFTFKLVGGITVQFPVLATYYLKYDLSFYVDGNPGVLYTFYADEANGVMIAPGATIMTTSDLTSFVIVSLDDGGYGAPWTSPSAATNGPWRVPPLTGEGATCSFPTAWTTYTRNNALIGSNWPTIDDAMAAVNNQIIDGGSAGTFINSDTSTSNIIWSQSASSSALDAEVTAEGGMVNFAPTWSANYAIGHTDWPCRYSQG